MIVVGAAVTYAAISAVIATLAIRVFLSSEAKRRPRSMSFATQAMIHGAFPDEAKVSQPIINILLLFNKCPSVDKVLQIIEKLMVYDRFRCHPLKNSKSNQWEYVEIPGLRRSDLITTHDITSETELMEKVDEYINAKGKFEDENTLLPYWEVIRLVNKNGTCGIIFRIHHVIGDGMSLVHAFSTLFTDQNGQPFRINLNIGGGAKGSGKNSHESILITLKKYIFSVVEVLGLALSKYDTNLPFSHTYPRERSTLVYNGKRRTIIFPTHQLAFLKDIKNAAGVTLNDVVFACTAGAIRKYCESIDPISLNSLNKIMYRALMPVAFPRKDFDSSEHALRNKWAFISVDMPMNGKTPAERLVEANTTMNEYKKKPTAGVQMWVQTNLLCILPLFLQRKTAYDIFSRHSLVFSNVPGPAEQLDFCEEKLIGLQVVFPNIIPQSLIVSYGGCVFYNLSVSESDMSQEVFEMLPKFYDEEIRAMAIKYGVDTSSMAAADSPGKVFGVLN